MGEKLLTVAFIFGLLIKIDQSFGIMEKQKINMVFMGSPYSGKDEVVGHLIFKTSSAPEEIVAKFEKINGRLDLNKYQFLMDELRDERAKQDDIILHEFETERRVVAIVDDGHQYFMDRLTSGAVKVDGAVLVISAVTGDFEDSMAKDGQFPRKVQLVHTLGITQLIVCVNKMDCADPVYCENRFNEIRKEVRSLLKHVGYDNKSVKFLPTTIINGENICIEPSGKMSWWKRNNHLGIDTLFEALDLIQPAHDSTKLPLEMTALDVQKTRTAKKEDDGLLQPGATSSPNSKNQQPGPDGLPAGSTRFDYKAT